MTKILTVDDSRAIRSIVTKQVAELGLQVDEAEDGQQGLTKLAAGQYGLVILDVTMPVMDGPEMLAQMRARGDRTPVLMLTSESKRSVISECMKAGIDDYIMKPFKAEELVGKIRKSLNLPAAGAAPAPAPAAPPPVAAPVAAPAASAVAAGPKPVTDILIIDDMENVQKKLRQLIPENITITGCLTQQAALDACHASSFRVVLLDSDIPDVNSAALLAQLKLLQPNTAVVSLTLRSANEEADKARHQGYADVLYKPFDRVAIEDFLLKYFDNQDLIAVVENHVHVKAYSGPEERIDRYYQRLGALITPALEKLAAACFDSVVFDLSSLTPRPGHTPRLVVNVETTSKKVGLSLRLVGGADTQSLLKGFTETMTIPFFPSVGDAKAA